MNILIVTDSYKDFASSRQIGEWLTVGLSSVSDSFKIKVLPIGDGGEGTIDALITAKKGFIKYFDVHDPLFREIKAMIGFYNDGVKTGVIEISQASGSAILSPDERNTMIATSYGTGEMILAAIDEGCKRILIGLGGSIISDGGMGMGQALGAIFLDEHGRQLQPVNNKGFNTQSLSFITSIDLTEMCSGIKEVRVIVAADVSTPLIGPLGQAQTFGPQKGATAKQIEYIEKGLNNWNKILKKTFGRDFNVKCAGAAGGLGAGLSAFMNGKLEMGIKTVLREINFEDELAWADVVVTGEGRLDTTSMHGKGCIYIAQKVKGTGKKVFGVFGIIKDHYNKLVDMFDYAVVANKDELNVHEKEFLEKIGPRQMEKAGIDLGEILRLHI